MLNKIKDISVRLYKTPKMEIILYPFWWEFGKQNGYFYHQVNYNLGPFIVMVFN
jgi:hypothetical protein